jgi:hypothetical protein
VDVGDQVTRQRTISSGAGGGGGGGGDGSGQAATEGRGGSGAGLDEVRVVPDPHVPVKPGWTFASSDQGRPPSDAEAGLPADNNPLHVLRHSRMFHDLNAALHYKQYDSVRQVLAEAAGPGPGAGSAGRGGSRAGAVHAASDDLRQIIVQQQRHFCDVVESTPPVFLDSDEEDEEEDRSITVGGPAGSAGTKGSDSGGSGSSRDVAVVGADGDGGGNQPEVFSFSKAEVEHLCSMGFSPDAARAALMQTNGDADQAANLLLDIT